LISKPEWKRERGELGVHGRIILKRILTKEYVRVWNGSSWLRIWTSGGLL
jgi:hypothetical protein